MNKAIRYIWLEVQIAFWYALAYAVAPFFKGGLAMLREMREAGEVIDPVVPLLREQNELMRGSK